MLRTPRRDNLSSQDRSRQAHVCAGKMVVGRTAPELPARGTVGVTLRRSGGSGMASAATTAKAAKSNMHQKCETSTGSHDGSDDSEDDIAAARRSIKDASKDATKAPHKPSKVGPAVVAASATQGEILDVHPAYFDYEARSRAAIARQEENRVVTDEYEEMVQFFQMHGLTGPLRTYAQSLALQDIKDPASLVQTDDAQLLRLIERADIECTDELILRNALQAYR